MNDNANEINPVLFADSHALDAAGFGWNEQYSADVGGEFDWISVRQG
ncbi:hypothetical protein [uncultured Thiocystis sp.]|nr:hypothetical protein [uncultured Thiocystis sp.]